MPFSGMIKLKLKCMNKIIKSIFYFSFILEFKKKRFHDTKTVQRERKKKKKQKEGKKRKDKKKID